MRVFRFAVAAIMCAGVSCAVAGDVPSSGGYIDVHMHLMAAQQEGAQGSESNVQKPSTGKGVGLRSVRIEVRSQAYEKGPAKRQ